MPGDHAQAELRVHTGTIAEFGRAIDALAGRLHDAAARTHRGNPGILAPVFGAVGTDFLAAFAAAHREHEQDLGRLSAALDGMRRAATATAGSYERAVDDTTAHLRAVGGPW